jgi:sialidase-1
MNVKKVSVICLAGLLGVAGFISGFADAPKHSAKDIKDSVVVFEPAAGKYSSLRIPALVISKKGTLLAFAAGRIESGSDWADMDLLLKRSEDKGKTWGEIQVVAKRDKMAPTDNPVPIVGSDGVIHLIYQRDYARAYHISSKDDGLTWSEPNDITPVFDAFKSEYDWKVLAPGPGHGIQLKNGRMVIPVWLANSDKMTPHRSHRPSRVAVIYSDDQGRTWQRGGMVPEAEGFINPSETMAVELKDGSVMLSIRNESTKRRKGVSYSKDGAGNWSGPTYEDDLFESICMSSIIRYPKKKGVLLFSNPDSENIPKYPRENLTIKMSKNDGKTWPVEKVLNPGSSAYSDLAVGDDGTIYCIYETKVSPKGKELKLVLKTFTLDWLTK